MVFVGSQHEEIQSKRDQRRKSAEKRKKAEKVFTEWARTKTEEGQLKKKQTRLTAEQLAAAETQVLAMHNHNNYYFLSFFRL